MSVPRWIRREAGTAVTDEAIEKIKGMIVAGTLRPGDRLSEESELAAGPGLSRNSLREAVRALSLIRILDVRQGDGTYVAGLDPQLLLKAPGFVVDVHRDDTVLEFLAVRRVLEPAATAAAATLLSEREPDALTHCPNSWTDRAPNRRWRTWSTPIRTSTGASCGARATPCSAPCSTGLSGPATRTRVWRGLTRKDTVGRTLREHRAVLAALRDRDAQAVRSWATVHVAGIGQWLRSTL